MTSTVPLLPDEILSLICEELGRNREYDALYQCASSARNLADAALRILYRYHEHSPAFIQSDEDTVRQRAATMDQRFKQVERSFKKWTILWRSIIASSLEDVHTYKPYCRYLKILDFRNLASMLEDLKFANTNKRDFFKGGLEQFHHPVKEGRRQGVNVKSTISAIGDAVVHQTFLLEEISGNLSPGSLSRWVARTPRLQTVVLYQGNILDAFTGCAITQYCENFRDLTVHEWSGLDADRQFARFLDELGKQSLESFEIISFNNLGFFSFQALSKQQSLRVLRLGNLGDEAIQHLNALKGCTEIHTLTLESTYGTTQLAAGESGVFVEVVEWLSACRNLRDLTLKRLLDGPAILAQVLTAPDVKLTKLSLEGYKLNHQSSAAFHTALSEQKTLQALWLRGDGEDARPEDLVIMVDALSNLDDLRDLELRDISDEFEEQHIIQLVLHLSKLEVLWTSGQLFTTAVLDVLANLRELKNLSLLALTTFSVGDVVTFIRSLNPTTQAGFSLSLMAQHSDFLIEDEGQEIIRSEIEDHLHGRFDYAAWREESSDEDDD